jgi:glycosyltransferase involved in cell wall biosynthesis
VAGADGPGATVVLLLDAGERDGVSGGDRYDAELVAAASSHGFSMRLVRWGRLRRMPGRVPGTGTADIVVIDSLVAWRAAVAVRRRRRPLTVALVHQRPGGTDGSRLARALRERLDLTTYRACDVVVTTGQALADDLARRGARQVHVIEPGCDLPPSEPVAPLRGQRRLGLIAVANWLPNKGIVDLLDAVERLPGDAVSLHLVGRTDVDPRYEAAVRSRVDRPTMRDRVVVHGVESPERVAALLAAADAFVSPSRDEAYGMAVAEALALGVPVVGWQTPHLGALVTHGADGLLVEPFDVGALARAIERLATDDELRADLTAGARRRGAELPRWSTTTEQFFALLSGIREAVPGSGRGATATSAAARFLADAVEPADDRPAVGDVDPAHAGILDEQSSGETHVAAQRPSDRGLDRADVRDDHHDR